MPSASVTPCFTACPTQTIDPFVLARAAATRHRVGLSFSSLVEPSRRRRTAPASLCAPSKPAVLGASTLALAARSRQDRIQNRPRRRSKPQLLQQFLEAAAPSRQPTAYRSDDGRQCEYRQIQTQRFQHTRHDRLPPCAS